MFRIKLVTLPPGIAALRALKISEALLLTKTPSMISMKLVIPSHSLYWSIHTKDESKRGIAFAFIFGVN